MVRFESISVESIKNNRKLQEKIQKKEKKKEDEIHLSKTLD
jgi:hypothetical protein